jgi:hypothetical protein
VGLLNGVVAVGQLFVDGVLGITSGAAVRETARDARLTRGQTTA